MIGWHHRLDGHEFEQASGVGDGKGRQFQRLVLDISHYDSLYPTGQGINLDVRANTMYVYSNYTSEN